MKQMAAGTVTGTGATINVSCGFLPDVVVLLNQTDAAAPVLLWSSTMDAGAGFKIKATAGSAYIATGGVARWAGTETEPAGFTIGTDADVNGNGDTIHWIAWRLT